MINTCDATIAGWSEDGETFVVKDPQRFQESCIPTYFKHAKFSSFVRQLNFYAFRKLKFADNIRIDPKLEAETANYWRFKHESFRRGRPELLSDIKRMNGQKGTAASKEGATPDEAISTATTNPEVQSLKNQIEQMSKNIDELTTMVQKVSLKQEEQDFSPVDFGAKRKKVDRVIRNDVIRPDEMLSSMDLDEMALPFISMPSPTLHREASDATITSDNEFADELFEAFANDDDGGMLEIPTLPEPSILVAKQEHPNLPNRELMSRLGEALALLPKDIQVLIVDRLIAAITSTDALENSSLLAAAIAEVEPKKVVANKTSEYSALEGTRDRPLTAATLAALLHHYGSQVKGKTPQSVQKSLPVIPVHA
jgi:hypothetical protein